MTTNKTNLGQSHEETASAESLLNSFVEAELKKSSRTRDDGGNDFTATCLHCAQALLANSGSESFSVYDFLFYCEPYQIPFEFKTEFFSKAVKHLIKNDRCQEIFGSYNFPVYKLL